MENCYSNWPLILEYLKVFLARPPLAFLLLAGFLYFFRTQLQGLIANIRKVEGFGGVVEVGLGTAQEQTQGVPTPPASGAAVLAEGGGDSFTARGAVTGRVATSQAQTTSGRADVSGPDEQTPLEKISSDPESARAEILRWWTAAKFESVLNRIFGTQLRLLIHLAQHSDGETLANLSPYYLEHKELATAAGLPPAPLATYVGFLTHHELLKIHGADGSSDQKASVTEMGRSFVEYVAANYTLNWQKAW